MIKFKNNKIVYTRTIKTNKHKKLHVKFTYPNNGCSFWELKTMFRNREEYIIKSCQNKNFPNNTVTEKYFMD
jgi:hypothetical protein